MVPPSWISHACKDLGLTVTYRHSRPDPALAGRANAVITALKPQ
ncbi:hypothetical protein [Actinomyces israelii]